MEENVNFGSFTITEMEGSYDEDLDLDTQSRDYRVEEPYDYIFEPNHNPAHTTPAFYTNLNGAKASLDQKENYLNGSKFLNRVARMVSEKDGVLEYEYNAKVDVRSSMDEDEEYFEKYFNDFDYMNHHLNAIIRSISLSKYPTLGFGFSLDKKTGQNGDLFCVKEIMPNSPAEMCLRLGDILIEIDERNPSDRFKSVAEAHEYLSANDNIHLMVIHESKYIRLTSPNEDLIRNCCINCEDMVIVSWNDQFEKNFVQ